MSDSKFLRLLREHIPEEELAALRDVQRELPSQAYEPVVHRVLAAVRGVKDQVHRNRRRIEELGQGVGEIPPSRLQMLLENSPPAMQLALARQAIRESWGERFDNQPRSLQLAKLGLRATEMVRGRGLLDAAAQADFESEAWLYLSNALRVNSDLRGAEKALNAAERQFPQGTGERSLKADLFRFKALLRFSQGRTDEAARLYDKEIILRRLLDQREALGTSLIARGVVAAWSESLEEACDFFAEGAALVEDKDSLILALNPIAERLARDGNGLLAWQVICQTETAIARAGGESHRQRLRWVKGITYRALGQHRQAARELEAVREGLLRDDLIFRAALASLDLAAVYVAQGRWQRVQEVVEEAYAVFVAERLERRALAAFLAFRLAARAETLTEALAAKVANFLVRSQYDRNLRFEPPSDQ